MGKYSYIGNYCTVINTDIGNYCSVGDSCFIGAEDHPTEWVSSSPVFHGGKNIMRKNFATHSFETGKRTVIENDVWLGTHCMIRNGIKIGTGAIIGMGSVVTKNVGDFEIWAGNPARFIRKRFAEEDISKILEIKWWEWSDTDLIRRANTFNDLQAFLSEGNNG